MFKFDKNLFLYKLPPVLYAALIITISTIPNASPPSLGVEWSDKIYHTLEYFFFGVLIFRAFPSVWESPRRTLIVVLLFLFGLAYGAIDERVQYYIPNRDSSPYDWMADALGYSIAGIVSVTYRLRKLRQRQTP